MSKATRTRVERGLYLKGTTYYACATPEGERNAVWKTLGEVNLSAARKLRDAFVAEVRAQKVVRSKLTFREVSKLWLDGQKRLRDLGELRPATYTRYEQAVRLHLDPYFGSRQVRTIKPDDVVAWHRDQQAKPVQPKQHEKADEPKPHEKPKPVKTLGKGSIRNHYAALRGILGYAARKGYAAGNPCDLLTRRERPKPADSRVRYLSAEEMPKLIDATTKRYKVAILLGIFTGVRLSELLGIRWRDIDFGEGIVRITGQRGRDGARVEYAKSSAGWREIVLMDALSKALKRHKLASPFSGPDDFVIASDLGNPMNPRNLAQRGLEKAAADAGLDGVTFHVLRHTFASILIAQGHPVTYVSEQLGHEKASVTLDVYSHLFARAQNAQAHRAKLDAEFGHMASGE